MGSCIYNVYIDISFYTYNSEVIQEELELDEDELWDLYDFYNKIYNEELDDNIDTIDSGWITFADDGKSKVTFKVEESDL